MTKLVFGVGINDGSRPARFDSKSMTKEYDLWTSMLRRCFDKTCLQKHPTYDGCGVSDNFLNYTYFYDWCNKQIGFGKSDATNRQWHLDKDILFKCNRLYSEDTCVFVPPEINVFFIDSRKSRGEYPLGVRFHSHHKYQSRCSVNGKPKHLGLFDTPEQAFNAYKPFKEALCKELALKWKDEIDARVYEAMMKWEVSITS